MGGLTALVDDICMAAAFAMLLTAVAEGDRSRNDERSG